MKGPPPQPKSLPGVVIGKAVDQVRKPYFERTAESLFENSKKRSFTPPNILDFVSKKPLSYNWSWRLWWKPLFGLCFLHGIAFSVESAHAELDADSLDKFNQITSANSSQLFDIFWVNNLPQWLTIIRLSLAFLGVIGVGWYAVWLARKSDRVGAFPFLDLVFPLVVIALLASGNTMTIAANSVRTVLNQANVDILELANAKTTIEQAETLKGYSSIMSTQIAQCDGQPPGSEQDECLNNASATINGFIANDEAEFGDTAWLKKQKERADSIPISGTVDAGTPVTGTANVGVKNNNPLASLTPEALAATFMTGVEKALMIILDQLIEAFTFILEAFYVLDALLLPIALLLALGPTQAQSLLAWVMSMVGIGSIKFFYFIIVAIAADLLLSSNGLLSILFALVAGVIAPIGAIILGGGGGAVAILSVLQFASHAANADQGE